MTDLITAAYVAAGLLMPPQQYVHEPAIDYRIVYVSPAKLAQNCPQEPGYTVLGCYYAWYDHTIFLRNDMTPEAARLVLRHELAHVNGWKHR